MGGSKKNLSPPPPPPPMEGFLVWTTTPSPWKFQFTCTVALYFPLKNLNFETPHPLGISHGLLWGGYKWANIPWTFCFNSRYWNCKLQYPLIWYSGIYQQGINYLGRRVSIGMIALLGSVYSRGCFGTPTILSTTTGEDRRRTETPTAGDWTYCAICLGCSINFN